MIATMILNNITLGTLNSGYLFKKLRGFDFPDIRVSVKERGNQSGARLNSQLYGRRVFVIEFTILGESASDYETKRRALEKALEYTGGTKRLKIYTRSGLELYSDVIVTSVDLGYEGGNVVFSEARIELTAPFPFIKSLDPVSLEINQFAGGGFAIPFAIPLPMATGQSTIATLTNNGNAYLFPIIKIYGEITNPTISDETNGQTFSITGTINDGHYVEIDTFLRTVTLDGTTNYKQYVSGDWLKFPSGASDVKLQSASYGANAKAILTYNHSYLGI